MSSNNAITRRASILAASILTTACGLFTTRSASAVLISVDFSPGGGPVQTGAAVFGAAGDVWNGLAGGSGAGVPLVDSTGAASGAAITYSSNFGGLQAGGSPMDAGTAPLMTDYLAMDGKLTTVSGLAPNTTYDLAFYGAGDQAAGDQGTTFILPGNIQSFTTETFAATGSRRLSDGAGVAYTLMSETSDASGNIQFFVTFHSTHFGTAPVNGFQIQTAVPEPATGVVLAGAGLALVARRSRRAVR